jgi:hypothetical protein
MMAYGSVTGVARINSHLTGGYTASSLPSAVAVSEWLEQGQANIDIALAKAGYSAPVVSTATVYPYIVRLNNLWAAAVAEASTNIGINGDAETRSDKLWQQYRDELRELLDGDLTLVGLSRSASMPVRRRVSSLPLRRYDGFAVNAEEVAASEYAQDEDE